jgi:hypothetical protein
MKIYFHSKGTKETKNCAENLLSPALVLHKFVPERESMWRAVWVIIVFVVIGDFRAFAQGTFQNLDFEQANPVVVSPFTVTAASGLPNWTVTIGGVEQTQITENGFSTGAPQVDLIGSATPVAYSPLDGNYSVLLQGTFSDAAISQTGVIPADTQSLQFQAQPGNGPGSLNVEIGTETVPYSVIGTGPNYTIYGANISAWAGDSEELTFSAPSISGNWEIDDISFSPTSITPEPDTFVLMGIGGALFAAYRRVAQKRK